MCVFLFYYAPETSVSVFPRHQICYQSPRMFHLTPRVSLRDGFPMRGLLGSVHYRAGVYYHKCSTWQKHQAMFPGWASVSEPRRQYRPSELISKARQQQEVQTDCLSGMLETMPAIIIRIDTNGSETKNKIVKYRQLQDCSDCQGAKEMGNWFIIYMSYMSTGQNHSM